MFAKANATVLHIDDQTVYCIIGVSQHLSGQRFVRALGIRGSTIVDRDSCLDRVQLTLHV